MKRSLKLAIILVVLLIVGLICFVYLDNLFYDKSKKSILKEEYITPYTTYATYIPKEVIQEYFEEEEEISYPYTEEEIDVLANCLYGEARGLGSTERSAVVWCVLNRVDSNKFPNDIISVVTQKSQFTGYNANRTYQSQAAKDVLESCRKLCIDVVERWYREKAGEENVGRTLPSTYCFFYGKHGKNWFRETWKGTDLWDWSLGTPYED